MASPMHGSDFKTGSRMSDTQELLERQARWQKARKNLTWSEKIRMAERVRATIRKLRVSVGERRRPQ